MSADHEHEHDAPTRAPGTLETVRAFVNTYDAETGADEIAVPRALAGWLEEAGLAQDFTPTAADVARAASLREALRALLFANNGAELDPAADAHLNAALAGSSLEVRFERGSAALVPRGGGLDAALARLGAIVREAMQAGDWARLKACPADDCQWAFYDRSRNRSRTWCSMDVCGNRAKVRKFREGK